MKKYEQVQSAGPSQGGSMIIKSYLHPNARRKLQAAFQASSELPSVTLRDIFVPAIYQQLCREVQSLSYSTVQQPGLHSYRYASLPLTLLAKFNSSEFRQFIAAITQRKVKSISFQVYSFTWKDYIALSDYRKEAAGLDIIIDCTPAWPQNAGGNIIYTDGRGTMAYVPARKNTLTLVQRNATIKRYVQYCNHYAQGARRYVLVGTVQKTL